MDIISMGEPLMELSDVSSSDHGRVYLPGFGGDTSNFAVAVARQGTTVGYFTRVGADAFGEEFRKLWEREKVDTSLVSIDATAHTGIYFITHTEKGHQFTYMRKGSAASKMNPADVPESDIAKARLLHTSGISQAISSSACDAVFRAIEVARGHNVLISYDPNLRLKLWPLNRARAVIHATVAQCDYFLPSFDDAKQLTGLDDPNHIVDYYLRMGVKTLALKLGANGVIVATPTEHHYLQGYKVDSVDATGAGDTFDGSFIVRLLEGASIIEAARYANAAAALSTTGYGAVVPIPQRNEVEAFCRG